ncbi:uncharacterized protein LOC120636852 [Pararge aegeria]|uniref:uncharacterized protein LOC120636852 n=1 Tax=Pararge aegeria TaxID=116150 RepID=UPI0019D0A933|nr:uncharacterized protein LOC120636852 [Pararge aegeria]
MSSSSEDTARSQVNTRVRQKTRKAERVSAVGEELVSPISVKHIKAPPFWAEKPNIWFRQVEGQFKMYGITDEETKFYQVLSSLERQYAAEVEDIITGPPDYTRLKTELIKRLSASKENKIKQLLTHEQIGSRKPSQFLRHLQHLAGSDKPADFLKTIWTSRLPADMQSIVASQQTLTLNALADLADRIYDIATPPDQVAAVTSSSAIDVLAQQVAELTKQVSVLVARDNQRSRSKERGRTRGSKHNRSRSRRSTPNNRRFPSCWYHHKFGSSAAKCVQPCNFNPTSGNGRSNQ